MSKYTERFLASVPASRRANADFTRPVSTSMIDLCYDCVGVSKEKKDAKEVKGNRGMFTLNTL
ncbi:unnamed protein product [Brassica napus]|uniref:(rape) hypothetical protein n=1 Tax=Brassica napus TaxID=3708 RepID=A0A816WXA4_BRANA|nr:unnamed protein product [Brassica napus]